MRGETMNVRMNAAQAILAGAVSGALVWCGLVYGIVAMVGA